MNADNPSEARISHALAQRGFTYKGRASNRWFSFEGALRVDDIAYPVRLSVDPLGQALPQIFLTPIPERLRPIAPHVLAGGYLCYAATGSITLDVFDPDGQVLACIERAECVLGQILRSEPTADFEEEFFAYWPADGYCLLDFDDMTRGHLQAIVLEVGGGTRPFMAITDRPTVTTEKLQAFGGAIDEGRSVAVRRIVTSALPRPLQSQWPPRTVADILRWQSVLDKKARKKLEQAIYSEAKTDANGVLCVVDSPKFKYAFAVAFDRRRHSETKRRSSLEMAYASKIIPMCCLRIDDGYLAQRNTPGRRTLTGKRIMLAGCGTIGGYLAESLVKAGAGTGGGELVLVDFDHLLPPNIGRHRLGINHLFHNKAMALAEEMKRSAPGASIRALPSDVLKVNLKDTDFVIDATGEEALGHLLVQRLSGRNFRPSLSVWIEGPGTAVRAMLRDSESAACVRCLKADDRTPIYPAVDGATPTLLAGHGCESLYVPFPSTVSMQAACLGADMMLDWANEVPTPRLRTRVLDGQYRIGCEDADANRRTSCPACGSQVHG